MRGNSTNRLSQGLSVGLLITFIGLTFDPPLSRGISVELIPRSALWERDGLSTFWWSEMHSRLPIVALAIGSGVIVLTGPWSSCPDPDLTKRCRSALWCWRGQSLLDSASRFSTCILCTGSTVIGPSVSKLARLCMCSRSIWHEYFTPSKFNSSFAMSLAFGRNLNINEKINSGSSTARHQYGFKGSFQARAQPDSFLLNPAGPEFGSDLVTPSLHCPLCIPHRWEKLGRKSMWLLSGCVMSEVFHHLKKSRRVALILSLVDWPVFFAGKQLIWTACLASAERTVAQIMPVDIYCREYVA